MANENSKKYEELIMRHYDELTMSSQIKYEEEKNRFNQALKIKEDERKLFLTKQNEIREMINVDREYLLAEKDNEIEEINKRLNECLYGLEENNKNQNLDLTRKIENIKQAYENERNSFLLGYDENKKRLDNAILEITNYQDDDLNYHIKQNEFEVEQKVQLVEKSNQYYLDIEKQNKDYFLNQTTLINNAVKKLKKIYIQKEDELKKNFEYNIYKLNEQIKDIQMKNLEDQKPYLNTFKNKFEKCDKNMHLVRNQYQSNLEVLTKKYRDKIALLKDNIRYYSEKVKRHEASPLETETLEKCFSDLKSVIKEASKEEHGLVCKHDEEIQKLHNIQKDSEDVKNHYVNLLKAEADYQIMEIQETIKYQNQLFDFEKRLLHLEEKMEINENEHTLSHEEVKKQYEDSIASSNQNYFSFDYQAKIDDLKFKSGHFKEHFLSQKNKEIHQLEINKKSNESITNLLIEKRKAELEFELKKLDNSLAKNNLRLAYAKKIATLKAKLRIDQLTLQKIGIEQEQELRINEVAFRENTFDAEHLYSTSLLRLDYAKNQKNIKSQGIIAIARSENDCFTSSMKSLNTLLTSIIKELNESLYMNFTTFGITKIEKMVVKATKDSNEAIRSYFKSIENIINKKIDDVASYRYNTLKQEHIDSKSDFDSSTQKKISDNEKAIEKFASEVEDNETQIIYLEIDNGTLYGHKSFLQRELKITLKDREFNQEKLVKRYSSEITSLNQSLEKNLHDILELRNKNKENNLQLERLSKEVLLLKHKLITNQKAYEKSMQKLEVAKIKEAKIYYSTIARINGVNKEFQELYQSYEKNILSLFQDDKMKKSNITQTLENENNEINQLTFKMENLLEILYRNTSREQNELLKSTQNRLHSLAKKAHKSKRLRIFQEKKRYHLQTQTAYHIISQLGSRKNKLVKNHLKDLLNGRALLIDGLIKCDQLRSGFDITYSALYKAMNNNILSMRKAILNEQSKTEIKDNEIIESIRNQTYQDEQKIVDSLRENATIHERELSSIEQRHEHNLFEIDDKNTTFELNNEKMQMEIKDTISSIKKAFDSAKEEITLERMQFYDELKTNEKKAALRPESFVINQVEYFKKIRKAQKIRHKWEKEAQHR